MCNDLTTGLLFGPAALGIKKGVQNILKSDPIPDPPALPTLPQPEEIKDKAKKDAKRRASLASKTVLTGGSGVIDDPQLKKPTILGG